MYLGREQPFSKLASEYWAKNCYVGLSPFNATTECSIDEIVGEPGLRPDRTLCFGTDRSMFGVDYPDFETILCRSLLAAL